LLHATRSEVCPAHSGDSDDLTGAGVLRTYFPGVLQLPIRDAQSGRIGIALYIQDAVPWMEAPVDALESRMEPQRF
jgi:hypothetical protein